MIDQERDPTEGPDRERTGPGREADGPQVQETPNGADQHLLRTRTGMAWVSVSAAALLAVALIVFMAQNTQQVHISFLWMDTSTSLALTLLIAVVGATVVTLVLGTARIIQLRRVVRKQRL